MDVLHVDDHILVVCKPAGVLAQPDHTGDESVLTLARRYITDNTGAKDPFMGLVHRLDRPTSGIMILARTSDAARHLSEQFRERTVSKQYVAAVEGRLCGTGAWTDYVAKLDRQPRIVAPDHPEGNRARLRWQAPARARGHTLLNIRLHTGRPHQIRLQTSQRGHPIVGDKRYDAESTFAEGAIALHHGILRVEHPTETKRQTFVAPLPDIWHRSLPNELYADVDDRLERSRSMSR